MVCHIARKKYNKIDNASFETPPRLVTAILMSEDEVGEAQPHEEEKHEEEQEQQPQQTKQKAKAVPNEQDDSAKVKSLKLFHKIALVVFVLLIIVMFLAFIPPGIVWLMYIFYPLSLICLGVMFSLHVKYLEKGGLTVKKPETMGPDFTKIGNNELFTAIDGN